METMAVSEVPEMSTCFFRPVDSPADRAGSLQSTVDALLGVPPLLQLLMLHNNADGFNGPPACIKSTHDLWSPTVFDGRLCSPLVDTRPAPTVTPVQKQAAPPALGIAPAMEIHSNTPPPQADKTEAEARAAEILSRGCTTLMVRNLPNKLTPAMIVECINELGYDGKYDYLFVPIDTNAPGWANRNLGYCFLNLVSPEKAAQFCLQAYGFSFRQAISSTKTSKISIAEEQGVLANLRRIARAANSKDHRTPKPNTYPYVRANGVIAPMSPTAALMCLDPDHEQEGSEETTHAPSCTSSTSSP
jgi:hypothetical protein